MIKRHKQKSDFLIPHLPKIDVFLSYQTVTEMFNFNDFLRTYVLDWFIWTMFGRKIQFDRADMLNTWNKCSLRHTNRLIFDAWNCPACHENCHFPYFNDETSNNKLFFLLQIVYSSHALRRISYATCEPSHKLVAFLSREPRSPPHLQHCHAFR